LKSLPEAFEKMDHSRTQKETRRTIGLDNERKAVSTHKTHKSQISELRKLISSDRNSILTTISD